MIVDVGGLRVLEDDQGAPRDVPRVLAEHPGVLVAVPQSALRDKCRAVPADNLTAQGNVPQAPGGDQTALNVDQQVVALGENQQAPVNKQVPVLRNVWFNFWVFIMVCAVVSPFIHRDM